MNTNSGGDQRQLPPIPNLTSDLHRVGGGYSVQFFIRNGRGGSPRFEAEWSPVMPSARELRRKVDLTKYRKARELFLQELARHVGGNVLCLEAGEVAQ